MKTKIFGIFLFSFLGITAAKAQEPLYNWGDPITQTETESIIEKFLGADESGIYWVRTQQIQFARSYWIDHFGPELTLLSSTDVKFNVGVMGNSQDIEGFERVGGKIYVFVSQWNKDAGSHTLQINELEGDELTNPKTLDVIAAEKMMRNGHFTWSFSDDGSQLLVLSDLPYEKKANAKIRLTCFDVPSLEKKYSKDIELSGESEKAYNHEIAVNNKGNAFLFKRHWEKPQWNYTLFTLSQLTQDWTEIQLGWGNKTLIDWELGFTPENNFTLAGTYKNESEKFVSVAFGAQVHGYFYYEMDGTLQPKITQITDWPTVVMETLGERTRGTSNSSIGSYRVKDLLYKSDGQPLVLLEDTKKKSDGLPGTQPVQFNHKYEYGPILFLGLNQNTGNVDWARIFDKHQEVNATSTGIGTDAPDRLGSFVYYLKNDRLIFLYNATDLSIPSIPPAGWQEPDGTRYIKNRAFDEKTADATFLDVLEPDGTFAHENRALGLPLLKMHNGAVFPMSMMTDYFVPYEGGLVIRAEMPNGGKRYRWGLLSY